MGICTGCGAEVADDQLNDGLCPNCSGGGNMPLGGEDMSSDMDGASDEEAM